MRKRGHTLPFAIVSAFVASLLMLVIGIHQTAHISSSNYSHDVSFDPPVPAHMHGRLLKNISNTSVNVLRRNQTAGERERQAREAARANKTAVTISPQEDLANVNISDTGDNVTVTDLTPKHFPHYPTTRYLGVLIDAGRHYFPISWLKDLLDVLQRMNYNFIHLRLTDDQAFNIQLESHPELAKPSPVNNPKNAVYTIDDLTDLIEYAEERNFTIMPEINVPGHAGAWAGYPNFIVPCPEFICLKGYGLPLNLSHPEMLSTIRNVIAEVRDIFSSSPYLHLGGDEVEMSQACFNEAKADMFNYTAFEASLGGVLEDLNISLDNVLRWEMTPGNHKVKPEERAGKMTHYWVNWGGKGHAYTMSNDTSYFVSAGLYFDSDQGENGHSIYNVAKMQASLPNQPVAIIGGTFELSTETWVDRNVMGRLLAVAMGAAQLEYNTTADFETEYLKYCHAIGLDDRACALVGMPISHQKIYEDKWNEDWDVWKNDICERLTVDHIEPIMNRQDRIKSQTIDQASPEFWNSFGHKHPTHLDVEVKSDNGTTSVASLPELAVDYLGLVVDLVHGTINQGGFESLQAVIDDMHMLGFNLLQLRIMDDHGMAIELHSLPYLAFLTDQRSVWSPKTIRQAVKYAAEKGIQVMPEISITTRAGGWANAGILAACPNVICNEGQGIAIDTADSTTMQIFAVVLRELRGLFSSDYLHLGYDERKEATKCYREAKITDPSLDQWEQRLKAVLRLEGFRKEKVWRWENTEGVQYRHRAGSVTNYRNVVPVRNSTSPFFVTMDAIESKGGWDIYQRTRKNAKAAATGIMTFVEPIESWDVMHIRERLLTITMGARQMKLNDEANFQSAFIKACNSLKLKNCQEFVAPNATASSHKLDDETKRKLRTEKLCQARTTPLIVKRPRKGVLIDEGGRDEL